MTTSDKWRPRTATAVHQTHNRDDSASNRVDLVHLAHETRDAHCTSCLYGRVVHKAPVAIDVRDKRP